MGNDRLASLDIARGFAIVFVVFLHCSSGQAVPHLYEAINGAVTGIRMPMLMLIAGLMASKFLISGRSLAPRAIHLAWLFALWTLIVWPLQRWSEGPGAPHAALIAELINPSTILWFLWLLSVLTLSLPLVRRMPPALVVSVAAVFSMAQDAEWIDGAAFYHHLILSSAVFFYIGALYGSQIGRLIRYRPLTSLGFLAPMIVLAWLTDGPSVDMLGWKLLELPRHAMSVLAVIYASELIGRSEALARPVRWLGRNTLQIYVMHPLVVIPATVAMGASASTNAMLVPLFVALAIGTTLLLHKLFVSNGGHWLFAPPPALCESLSQRFARGLGSGPERPAISLSSLPQK